MTAATILTNLFAMSQSMQAAAKEAVDDITDEIYTESTEVFCPVKYGVLKGSAKNEVVDSGQNYTRKISYNTDYAKVVHERSNAKHTNPPTASWKYLEIPYRQISPKLPSVIKAKFGGIGRR